MVEPRLEGKIAVVTGGGTGLGRALVLALAERGRRRGLLVSARARAAPKRRRRRCARRDAGSGPRRADARRPGEISGFVERAAAELGGIDLLVNNVGVFRKVPLAELTEDVLDEAFAVNVKAAVMASRAAAPHMRRRGGGVDRERGQPGRPAAVAIVPGVLRDQGGAGHGHGVPGPGAGPGDPGQRGGAGHPRAARARASRCGEQIPQRRFGTPAEAVEAVLFLAAGGGYTTGEVIRVDGGRALR